MTWSRKNQHSVHLCFLVINNYSKAGLMRLPVPVPAGDAGHGECAFAVPCIETRPAPPSFGFFLAIY
jgi:hypothetical protein